MQERAVTLLGTAAAAQPVFVLASQARSSWKGRTRCPKQLDRFLFKLIVPVADIDVLDRIVATRRPRAHRPRPGSSRPRNSNGCLR